LEKSFYIAGKAISERDKICVIGDSGVNNAARENVFKALEKENCSELRVLGDIIYDDGLVGDIENKNKQFQEHVVYLKKLNIPVYMVLGNHDDYGDEDSMIELSAKNGINYPNHFYSEKRGNICLVSIFSDTSGAKDLVINGINQREWLAAQTHNLRGKCNFMIGLGHHIYKSNGTHRKEEPQGAEFYEEQIIGKYDLYLSGHDHHLEDVGYYGGTKFLISGAAAKTRDLLDAEQWHESSKWAAGGVYGYMTLQFNGDCAEKKNCAAEYKFYVVSELGEASMMHSEIIAPTLAPAQF